MKGLTLNLVGSFGHPCSSWKRAQESYALLSNFRGAQSHVWKAGSVDKSEGGVGRRREEGREEENTSLCPIHFSLMDYFFVVVWSFMQ